MLKHIKDIDFNKISNIAIALFLCSFLLPSGIIFGVNLQKYFFLILLCISLFSIYIYGFKWKSNVNIHLLVLITSLVIWLIYGVLRHNPDPFAVLNGLLLPFLSMLAIVQLIQCFPNSIIVAKKCLWVLLISKLVLKLVMEFVFVSHIMNYEEIILFYNNILNTEITTMTVSIFNIDFIRLMHAGDYLVFVLVPFFLFFTHIKKYAKSLLFILWLSFSLIVYSRLYLFYFFLISVILFILIWIKLSKKLKCVSLLFLMLIILASSPIIYQVILQRFFSVGNANSDLIRVSQSDIFYQYILKKPVFGYGLGAYIEEFIRSNFNLFSYEKEYLSLIYQSGILGFILIVCNMIYLYVYLIEIDFAYFRALIKDKKKLLYNKHFLLFFLIVFNIFFFIARPMFNPGLFGYNNGIIFLALFILNRYYKNECGDSSENISCNYNI